MHYSMFILALLKWFLFFQAAKFQEQHYLKRKEVVLETDIIVIDEVSMLSVALFESLEYIFR